MASSTRPTPAVSPETESGDDLSHAEEYAHNLASRRDNINLGCGPDYRSGWLNTDISEQYNIDMSWNLEDTPWPWPESSFETALVDNVLEHIEVRQRTDFLQECHRILEPGGELVLRLPVPEVGVGWDETHYPIPSWKLLEHPRWQSNWEIQSYQGKRVGLGRLLPEPAARLAARQWLRCVDEVTVRAEATK